MIKQAKFLTSVADSRALPGIIAPEIAIAGKSNVGKSSFINFLTNQNKLAKTSSDPGRTRLLNYFEINNGEYFFVDLPGYGYAKVAKEKKQGWGEMIEGYLTGSHNLKNVFVLVDIRHTPTDDDKGLINFLFAYNIPFTIIATKADKVSRMQLQKNRAEIASALGVGVSNIYAISSTEKTGKEEVLARIDQILAN
ncbi:MAG: ribosome biogenesis GTP-binding protein YihA/YsxC [Clostridia bacterium]